MKTDIILAGVGGQGILSIATVIGQAALKEDLYIKQAEVHGMSQRGGDVQSNLRLSDKPINSDLIALGQADIIIAMEPMEALRYRHYLSPEGWIIPTSNAFVNIGNYPDQQAVLAELPVERIFLETDLGEDFEGDPAGQLEKLYSFVANLKGVSRSTLNNIINCNYNNYLGESGNYV